MANSIAAEMRGLSAVTRPRGVTRIAAADVGGEQLMADPTAVSEEDQS
jgi:hypothetical protein